MLEFRKYFIELVIRIRVPEELPLGKDNTSQSRKNV